jgi:hypothetical protein
MVVLRLTLSQAFLIDFLSSPSQNSSSKVRPLQTQSYYAILKNFREL